MSTSGSVAQSSQPALPTQNEELEAPLQSSRQKTDPAWDHCIYKVVGKKKTFTCMFCNKQINGGGIHRLKEHLAGVKGDVKRCLKVDADTKFRMQESLNETALKKRRSAEIFDDEHPFGPNVVELTDDGTSADVPTSSRPKKKATTTQGTSKDFFAPSTTPGAQPTIKSVLAGKKAVHECDIAIATFFYENCIPINATNSSSYQRMIDAITRMSAGYKGPNYHAMRTRLLSDMKKNVQLLVDNCRSQWSILKHQHDLQALVTHKTFVESRYYRDPKARDFIAAVLDSKFWNDVEIIVKIVAPLVCLLRIVDGDDRPSLGYVYDGMFRAKKAIKKIFMNKKSLYKPYTRIIKQRWDKHLRQQLHAAAYVLNPTFYYDSANLSQKPEVMAGFLDVLTAQIDGNKTKFLTEANRYREKIGEFGKQLALDSIKHMRPDMWWNTFGHEVPNVKKWAIKILSQTASSSGCERNWSVFERIHTKKRNRLEHQRAFNKNGAYDPIDYERINDIEFWIMEEDTNSTPILDADEIESMLYNEESIPIIGLDNEEGELAPTIGLEEGRLNLDSFPQEDVNSYSGDDGFHQFAD
ncbi:hypothetical protein QL285_025609 [Trifolium repens]|nr:hypothetical protein QL285_025609 [Trifolium repens]